MYSKQPYCTKTWNTSFNLGTHSNGLIPIFKWIQVLFFCWALGALFLYWSKLKNGAIKKKLKYCKNLVLCMWGGLFNLILLLFIPNITQTKINYSNYINYLKIDNSNNFSGCIFNESILSICSLPACKWEGGSHKTHSDRRSISLGF